MMKKRIVYCMDNEDGQYPLDGWVAEILSEMEDEPVLAICSRRCRSRAEARASFPLLEAMFVSMMDADSDQEAAQ